MNDNPYRTEVDAGAKRSSLGRWISTLLIFGGLLLLVALLVLPNIRIAREPARRSQCKNHLKNLALSLLNYHDTYGAFPPAYTVDAEGKPLHSWRTLLLPFTEGKPLYEKIDLTKPWDDPVNANAFASRHFLYECPSARELGNRTTYLAVVAPGSCFEGEKSCNLKDIADGPTQTLLLIEVDEDHAVPWMAPVDADEALFLALNEKSKLAHPAGFHGVFADASVDFLSVDLPAETRHAMITIAGGEAVKLPEE